MKTLTHFFKAFALSFLLCATAIKSSAALFLSEPTNHVYVAICGRNSSGVEEPGSTTNGAPIHFDDQMLIGAFCETGQVNLLIPVNKAFFINFSMRDASGKEIEKTGEGRFWGSDVKNFPAEPGRNNRTRMARWVAPGPHTSTNAIYSLNYILPAPSELFKMQKKGIYDLRLDVRLMKQHMVTNGWVWDPLSIPPFTVKVEKP